MRRNATGCPTPRNSTHTSTAPSDQLTKFSPTFAASRPGWPMIDPVELRLQAQSTPDPSGRGRRRAASLSSQPGRPSSWEAIHDPTISTSGPATISAPPPRQRRMRAAARRVASADQRGSLSALTSSPVMSAVTEAAATLGAMPPRVSMRAAQHRATQIAQRQDAVRRLPHPAGAPHSATVPGNGRSSAPQASPEASSWARRAVRTAAAASRPIRRRCRAAPHAGPRQRSAPPSSREAERRPAAPHCGRPNVSDWWCLPESAGGLRVRRRLLTLADQHVGQEEPAPGTLLRPCQRGTGGEHIVDAAGQPGAAIGLPPR